MIKARLHYGRIHWGIWSETEIENGIEPLLTAAEHCRQALKSKDRVAEHPECKRALSDIQERIDQHIRSFAPSHILGKKGRLGQGRSGPVLGRDPGDDDIICAQVRALAVETDKLFGGFMCPTLATVAMVALGQTIHDQQVAKWCKRQPALPLEGNFCP